MTDVYAVQIADADIADAIWSAALAATPANRLVDARAVVAIAVRTGRAIGARQVLEPLDDAMKGAARDAIEHVQGKGLHGLVDCLYRLDAFLQRYPARGRADLAGAGAQAKGETA